MFSEVAEIALVAARLGQFQQLPKTRVILILNFTRPHAITYTNGTRIFHWEVSTGKMRLPFQEFRLFRKISSGTNQKVVFHLQPDRNFRNFSVNGKRSLLRIQNLSANSLALKVLLVARSRSTKLSFG